MVIGLEILDEVEFAILGFMQSPHGILLKPGFVVLILAFNSSLDEMVNQGLVSI